MDVGNQGNTGPGQPLDRPALEVIDLGRLDYDQALSLQRRLVEERIAGTAGDRLLLVEHPPVITLGLGGTEADLLLDEAALAARGVPVFRVERGGKATFHGPGQLVAYPILKLRDKDLHAYLERMLSVAVTVLAGYGLTGEVGLRGPGVWVGGAKIASIGLAVRKWVTFHGLALNVNTDLAGFGLINPCGYAGERMTSMAKELGRDLDAGEVSARYVRAFREIFSFAQPVRRVTAPARPKRPDWLCVPAPSPKATAKIRDLLAHLHLDTVCQEAHCPNIGECFGRGTSAFMILGTICTRACRYCAVHKGRPVAPDPGEPDRLGQAVAALNLKHVVVTSVTRDDLEDGGAGHFAATIEAIRRRAPGVRVEVLVPDFAGSAAALGLVCDARPDVFNHNIETVPRLFPSVRPKADYAVSLGILRQAAARGLTTKSGLMLGLGETDVEIEASMADLRQAGCRLLTLGQYLAPSREHAPIARYVAPETFAALADTARAMGFVGVAAGPLVRSSYRAEDLLAGV